jgi:hypothetical protein
MIKSPAIKHDKKVFIGKSHGEIMHEIITDRMFNYDKPDYTEGFIDEYGDFLDRQQAAKVAFDCGQIPEKKYQLFSYDLVNE